MKLEKGRTYRIIFKTSEILTLTYIKSEKGHSNNYKHIFKTVKGNEYIGYSEKEDMSDKYDSIEEISPQIPEIPQITEKPNEPLSSSSNISELSYGSLKSKSKSKSKPKLSHKSPIKSIEHDNLSNIKKLKTEIDNFQKKWELLPLYRLKIIELEIKILNELINKKSFELPIEEYSDLIFEVEKYEKMKLPELMKLSYSELYKIRTLLTREYIEMNDRYKRLVKGGGLYNRKNISRKSISKKNKGKKLILFSKKNRNIYQNTK